MFQCMYAEKKPRGTLRHPHPVCPGTCTRESTLPLVLELWWQGGEGRELQSNQHFFFSPASPFPVIVATDHAPQVMCLGRLRIAQQPPRECAVWLQSLLLPSRVTSSWPPCWLPLHLPLSLPPQPAQVSTLRPLEPQLGADLKREHADSGPQLPSHSEVRYDPHLILGLRISPQPLSSQPCPPPMAHSRLFYFVPFPFLHVSALDQDLQGEEALVRGSSVSPPTVLHMSVHIKTISPTL